MSTWADFYDHIMPELPGNPQMPMVDNALRNASIDFFDFSGAWTEDLTTLVTVIDQAIYDLPLPVQTNTAWINKIRSDSREVDSTTAGNLTAKFGSWEIQKGQPVNYIQPNPDQIRVYAIPDDAYNLYINAALKPSRSASGIPDALFNAYYQDIVSGALERLMRMSKKPWSDKQMAVYYGGLFNKAKGDARVDAMRSFTTSSVNVQSRAFG